MTLIQISIVFAVAAIFFLILIPVFYRIRSRCRGIKKKLWHHMITSCMILFLLSAIVATAFALMEVRNRQNATPTTQPSKEVSP